MRGMDTEAAARADAETFWIATTAQQPSHKLVIRSGGPDGIFKGEPKSDSVNKESSRLLQMLRPTPEFVETNSQ